MLLSSLFLLLQLLLLLFSGLPFLLLQFLLLLFLLLLLLRSRLELLDLLLQQLPILAVDNAQRLQTDMLREQNGTW